MNKITECKKCHHIHKHATGWGHPPTCGYTLQSGPCSSDYEYCKCTEGEEACKDCDENHPTYPCPIDQDLKEIRKAHPGYIISFRKKKKVT